MKKTKVVTITMILIVTILLMINPIVNATIDPDEFDPSKNPITVEDTKAVTNVAGPIINIIATIGIVVSIIGLMIIGIKYMIGTVEEKAEYKKTMIPYIVGIFMIVGTTQLLNIIYKIVINMNTGT